MSLLHCNVPQQTTTLPRTWLLPLWETGGQNWGRIQGQTAAPTARTDRRLHCIHCPGHSKHARKGGQECMAATGKHLHALCTPPQESPSCEQECYQQPWKRACTERWQGAHGRSRCRLRTWSRCSSQCSWRRCRPVVRRLQIHAIRGSKAEMGRSLQCTHDVEWVRDAACSTTITMYWR